MNFPEVLKSSRVFLISLACAQPEPIEPLFNLIPLIFSSFLAFFILPMILSIPIMPESKSDKSSSGL